MLYVTGDIHGLVDDPDRFDPSTFPAGEHLTRDDYVLVLGDFCLPLDEWDNGCELDRLAEAPWTTLFVDGNHEYFPYLADIRPTSWHGGLVQRYPGRQNIIHLMRGEVYELCGSTCFTLGGATSVDRAAREPYGLWFPEELPSASELAHARETLAAHDWQVDYVFTHTCATRHLPAALGIEGACGDPDAPHPDIQTDALTDFLDELEDRLAYRRWYFGHMHHDWDIDASHTLLYQEIVPSGESLYPQR